MTLTYIGTFFENPTAVEKLADKMLLIATKGL